MQARGNSKESEMPSRQSEGESHRKPGVKADTCGVEELGTGHWSLELHRGRCISWKEKLDSQVSLQPSSGDD